MHQTPNPMKQRSLSIFIFFLLSRGFPNTIQAQPVSFPQGYGTGLCGCDTTAVIDSTGKASPGQIILETGMKMAMSMEKVVYGSCWNFVNAVFNRSEIAGNKKVVFKSKKSGPYAQADAVQPGDWIYHVNYQYKNIDHSAIFVCWKDVERRIAITLSYAGMNRKSPARYAEYDLRSIYAIFRPQVAVEKKTDEGSSGINPSASNEQKEGGE
jgi:hypothetical protein